MIQAAIFIELINGTKIKYVRDALVAKTGTDGATVPNQMFAGYPGEYYMYTGDGNDKYANQTGTGKIAGDLASLQASLASATALLTFPESTPGTELIRYNEDIGTGKRTYIRQSVVRANVTRIFVEEKWITSPVEADAQKTLPSWSGRIDAKETFTMPESNAFTPRAINFTGTPTDVTIVLTWEGNTDYEKFYVGVDDKFVAYGTGTTYTITGLTQLTSYSVSMYGVTGNKTGPVIYKKFTTIATI